MKKIVFILFIIVVVLCSKKQESYIIPKDAIRFRIIANSNNIEDQKNKVEIKRDLESEFVTLLSNAKDYQDANSLLTTNLNKIEGIIKNKTSNYSINLGLNYFPEKEYKNIIYPEGRYNSLVVTLGEGLGNNWWCVLYPPLCFIDDDKLSDSEYSFFIKDLFNKIKK